jgi:acetyl-CoA decarbonylase/synthase complex subunit gamma
MALKGLDIFKHTPKTNCKDCGNPTCMAFSMKVAQGVLDISKCPHLSADLLAKLAESTAPPMKSLTVKAGDTEYKIGGETVLYRHERRLSANPFTRFHFATR